MPQTNARRRELYALDPEYKEKVLARNLKARQSPERKAIAAEARIRWRAANPERQLLIQRKNELKAKFGLSLEDYQSMHDSQKGVCAICNKEETEVNRLRTKVKFLAVDHDHTTGKVRGLLCSRCNSSIGKFEESPELLRRAAQYIEDSK